MLQHHLKIIFRNFLKYKVQFFTAIIGLVFGLICLIPTLSWLYYEMSFDSFYSDSKSIYRVYSIEKLSGKESARVPGILKEELTKHFPAIANATDFLIEQLDYETENGEYFSLKTVCADSSFFDVFPQRIICGDFQDALQLEGSIVLTESAALRIWGDVDEAVGKKFEHELSRIFGACTVTAVVEDHSANTNVDFDAIFNLPAIHDASMIMPVSEQWNYFNNDLYIKVHKQADINLLASELKDFTTEMNVNQNIELCVLPIDKVRHKFNSNLPFNLYFIQLLVSISILLMLASLFNFFNLHYSLFRRRTYEFRMRVIQGASGYQIVSQMIFELLFSTLIAVTITSLMLYPLFVLFRNMLNIDISLSLLFDFFALCSIVVIFLILILGLIFCLHLKSTIVSNLSARIYMKQPVLQKVSVIFQLAITMIFIIATLVIMSQMYFISERDLGFNKDAIIQLYSADPLKLEAHQESLKQQFSNIPQIQSISMTEYEPTQSIDVQNTTSEVDWQGKESQEKIIFQWIFCDDRFAETFQLEMLKGKWWNEGERDSRKIVINEEAARMIGIENPVGMIIRMNPSSISSEGVSTMEEYEIAGVVKDFHSLSLKSPIYPTIFRPSLGVGSKWYVRVMPGTEYEVMRTLSDILSKTDASLTNVRITLLNDLYEQLNYSEQCGLKLFSFLSFISLSISLFGVYAIATETTQRRQKEIAIRKVLGANKENLILMFFKQYILQTLIAGVIAIPIAYVVMQYWLQGYAYKADISLGLLFVVLILIMVIVLFVALIQILKAVKKNPIVVIKNIA